MPNGYDKNWIRLCAVLDGFKVRFRHWPSRVMLSESILRDLDRCIFEPKSMARIRERILFIVKENVLIVAQDEFGNQYSYEDEGFPKKRPKVDARKWLDVKPDRPNPGL